MFADNGQFAVKPLLEGLRAEFGDAEFGYRMQGMFAHVLARLGGEILEINAQGHPDIKARLADDLVIVQVKSCEHRSSSSAFRLSESDLAGIKSGDRIKGYLAFLDLNRYVPITVLEAAQDEQLSTDCTGVFVEIVLAAKDRLSLLTYPLLSARAISGKPL